MLKKNKEGGGGGVSSLNYYCLNPNPTESDMLIKIENHWRQKIKESLPKVSKGFTAKIES